MNELQSPIHITLKEYLTKLSMQGHKLTQLKDESKFNLLHHCVLKGVTGKLEWLVDTVK